MCVLLETIFYADNYICLINLGMQYCSNQVQGEHFQIKGYMEVVRKMCIYQPKTDHISQMQKDKT